MTEAELIGMGGVLGAVCRYGFGFLLARRFALQVRDLSANVIGPTVVTVGVHAGLAPALPPGGRVAVATGALGGYMVVATLGAGNRALVEENEVVRSVIEILAAALGCLVAGAIGLALTRCFS